MYWLGYGKRNSNFDCGGIKAALTRQRLNLLPSSPCTGLLGIAGALLFNPFLLAIGVQPQVVAATAIVIVLFGSGAISLSFWCVLCSDFVICVCVFRSVSEAAPKIDMVLSGCRFSGMLNTSYVAVSRWL